MATTLTFTPTNCQLQSPLFGVLPGEIRNDIFALALMPYEDKAATYPEDSYWYRPGFSASKKSNSVLLRTCKAAYAEGQKVFLRDLEYAFWFDRGPAGRSGNHACMNFFRNLAPIAVEALQKLRFFTQMYWLESGSNLSMLLQIPQLRPSQITITIRYSDWWNWEDDQPLSMNEQWLRSFNGSPGLRELRVEYETRVPKKDEMMRIVERNRKWKLPVRREGGGPRKWEGYLTAENTKLNEWTWKGTSKLGGQQWAHLAKSDTIEYAVVTDVWKFVEGELSQEELSRHDISQSDLEENDFDGFDYEEDYYTDEEMNEDEDDEEDDEDVSEYEEEDSDGEVSNGAPGACE